MRNGKTVEACVKDPLSAEVVCDVEREVSMKLGGYSRTASLFEAREMHQPTPMAKEHSVRSESLDSPVIAGLPRTLNTDRGDDNACACAAGLLYRAFKSKEFHPVELNLFKTERERSLELLFISAEGNEERCSVLS